MDNTDSVKIFYDDAIANKLTVLGPDVNASEYRFTPVDRRPSATASAPSRAPANRRSTRSSRRARAAATFKDLFDFCERVDKRMVNRRTIEALIRAGAFDSLDDHRARLMASVGIAMEAAEQAERNALQVSLFDVFDSATQRRTGRSTARCRAGRSAQQLAEEKLALGFFFSGHPFHGFQAEVSRFRAQTARRACKPAKGAAAPRRPRGRRAHQVH